MNTTEISQKLDSINWGTPQPHYIAREQAPEIFAMRLKQSGDAFLFDLFIAHLSSNNPPKL